MAELVHQTWSRVTGKPWSAAAAGGFTTGTAQANLALQAKLNSGWNPYAPAAAAPAPAPAAAPAASPTQTAATNFSTALTGLSATQNAEEQRLLAERAGFVNSQESLPALYQRLLQEAGVPGLQAQLEPVRQQTLTTEGQLSNLQGDVADLTRGQGEARRRLVEAGRQAPLVQQLSDLARAQERFAGQISSATQGVGTQTELYGEEFKRKLSNYETALSSFGERAAREASMFTTAKEAELNAVLADIKRAQDLSDQEAQKAFDLLKMQKDFEYQKSLQESSGGGDGSSSGGEINTAAKLNTFINSLRTTAKTNPDAAQNALWNFLRAGGTYEATYGKPGKDIISSFGQDPQTYWNLWNEWKNGTGSGGVSAAKP